ncbi:MAG: DUF3179 domain-containing protein [Flammeovirgaceae bacterium]|nr:DUF3179 domain-containing protein [Flammeovirgaceae bacterium]MDW8286850.1 DUF3179 domain-containing (seleno)protein [Flammeovirgaceae bacterium]
MKKLIVFFTVFLFTHSIFAQRDEIAFIKQYWKTDKSNFSIDPKEFKAYLPKDAFPILNDPVFLNSRESHQLYYASEPLLVVSLNGVEKAYPLTVLRYHGLVNDRIAGEPILVTYCMLSGVARVFSRDIQWQDKSVELVFGFSGMLCRSNIVLYDQQTKSWWNQLTGKATVGVFNQVVIRPIPAIIMPFKDFFKTYPYGLILKKVEKNIPYHQNPYYRYDADKSSHPFLFAQKPDGRLLPKEKALFFELGNKPYLFPYERAAKADVFNLSLNHYFVTVFFADSVLNIADGLDIDESSLKPSPYVYASSVDGQVLTFQKKNNTYYDQQTHSQWNRFGECIEGELKGKKLERIPFFEGYSFALLAFYPQAQIFYPD